MYVTQRPNDVLALDAKTGRVFWQYRYTNSPDQRVCCGANNRGVAIHGDTLYMGTLDAHLVAIDAKNGQPIWNIAVADSKLAYSVTLAPLVIKDKVIIGVGGARVRHPRLRGGLRCANGQGGVAVRDDPAPGREGQRDLGRQLVGARRRLDLGHGLVRSGAEPDLLGRRQPGARLEPGSTAGRQPVHGLGGGARRRHRRAEVALPVHAQRRLRLRRGAGAGAGGHRRGTARPRR